MILTSTLSLEVRIQQLSAKREEGVGTLYPRLRWRRTTRRIEADAEGGGSCLPGTDNCEEEEGRENVRVKRDIM
jgi:hypothetical protein